MLLEGYGMTEASPCIAFNSLERYRVGTVGPPLIGVDVKIAEDGEILSRGPHVMLGYWKDPEATAATVVDGWLYTGDVGQLDEDGFLTITDRKKDLIVTSGGKNVAPSEIERLLTSDPLIDQAVVFGDRRPFVAALIVANMAALDKVASEHALAVETDGEFLRSGPTFDLLSGRISRLMEAVSQPERVRAFAVLTRPFRVDDGEVTPTLKVRRKFILAKYADRLDELYRSDPS